jgi:hypothetical protein
MAARKPSNTLEGDRIAPKARFPCRTGLLTKVKKVWTGPKDVKNEDRPDYVHENTDESDIMSSEKHGSLQENATIAH